MKVCPQVGSEPTEPVKVPLLSGLSLSFVFVLLAFKFVVGQFDIAVRVFRYFGGGRRCALEVGGALCCPIIIPP
ncbi:MAG TPA: hypothetical protein DD982_06185 [Thalassospira sp.]|nr:hypothetical protein C9939_05380 [Pseudidiomarina aestuarii]HBS22103.1 hypothetical protein [Thalassospira sp.]